MRLIRNTIGILMGHSLRDVPFFLASFKRVSLLAPSECINLGAISNRQLLWTRVRRFQHLAVSDRIATPGIYIPRCKTDLRMPSNDEEYDYRPSDDDVTLTYISLQGRRSWRDINYEPYCLHCSLYSVLTQTFHVFSRAHWVFSVVLAPLRPPWTYATFKRCLFC